MNRFLRGLAVAALGFAVPLPPAVAGSPQNAYLYLKIYQHASEVLADRPLGYVPADPGRPLPRVPKTGWYVRVQGALSLFTTEKLAGVLRDRGIPGVDFSAQAIIGDTDMGLISTVPGLRFLTLAGTRVSDQGLGSLGGLKDLEVLRLSAAITDAGLAQLSDLSDLRELGLKGTAVTDRGLAALRNFRDLESLDLSDTAITDDGLRALEKLPLRSLILGGEITDRGLKNLRALKTLQHLDLSRTRVTDEGIKSLQSFRSLRTLFASRQLTRIGLVDLAELKALRRLDLTGTQVTDTSLSVLLTLPHLEELALSDTGVGDDGLRRLNKLERLRILEISGTAITPDGWAELKGIQSLEIVSLSWREGVRRSALKPLFSLSKLRLLIANGHPVRRSQLDQMKDVILAPSPATSPENSGGSGLAALPGMDRLYRVWVEDEDSQIVAPLDGQFI